MVYCEKPLPGITNQTAGTRQLTWKLAVSPFPTTASTTRDIYLSRMPKINHYLVNRRLALTEYSYRASLKAKRNAAVKTLWTTFAPIPSVTISHLIS